MITTDRVANYAQRNKEYLQQRNEKIEQVTKAEVDAIRGPQVAEHAEERSSAIFDFYSSDAEMFYNEIGFSIDEFEHLFMLSADCFIYKGKGRKPQISQRDILVVLLHFLRRYPKLEEMSAAYGTSVSKLAKIIDRAIDSAYERFVPLLIDRPAADINLPVDQNVPECGYIIDATVQRIQVPAGDFTQKKKWFSGKHYCYCLKSQVITDMKGAAIMVSSGYYGSMHDLALFRETTEEWRRIALLHPKIPAKILGDKGYQANDIDCLVTPIKGSADKLTRQDNAFNERIGKTRIVVENFFGRLKNRYGIIGSVYRHSHDMYSKIFKLCCALTNFEIRLCNHGLRREDGDWYSKYYTNEVEAMKNRAQDEQERRRDLRRRRMERIYGE